MKELKKLLVNYLENECCFRDYTIKSRKVFGQINKIAVHQVVDKETLENDVDNAIDTFCRNGHTNIVFYI